jgi:hypothetical protein
MKDQANTRRAFLGALGALSAFGIARFLPACSGAEDAPPAAQKKQPPKATPPATDDDEHVPGPGETPKTPDDGQVGNAVWEQKAKALEGSNAGGAAYTTESPGPWAGKEKSHVPSLTVQEDGVAMILVSHVMDAGFAGAEAGASDGGKDAGPFDSGARPIHYVTTIWVKDDKGRVVYLKELKTTDIAPPVVAFRVPAGTQSLRAYEHCNLHGVWGSAIVKTA